MFNFGKKRVNKNQDDTGFWNVRVAGGMINLVTKILPATNHIFEWTGHKAKRTKQQVARTMQSRKSTEPRSG